MYVTEATSDLARISFMKTREHVSKDTESNVSFLNHAVIVLSVSRS
jgi:hypothetical protein